MKHSLAYLERKRDESAASLEESANRVGDALTEECAEVTRRRPVASLAVACALGAALGLAASSGSARSAGRSLRHLALLRTLAAGFRLPAG